MRKIIHLAIGALFFAFFYFNGRSQTISTLAGTGLMGYSGDGGPATLATIKLPWGIVVDKNKNVYYADGSFRIRKIDTSGVITTYAGDGTGIYSGDGGPAISAGFTSPLSLAIDTSGCIYVTTTGVNGNRIRKIDASGIITTIAGTGTAGYSGDGGPATSATLRPTCVATDNSGNIYIGEWGNNCVRKINAAGIITTIAGNGMAGYSGDGGLATSAQLNGPHGVAVDLAGNVYIADQTNYRIRKVNPSGIITTYAGTGINGFSGDGGPAAVAQLSYQRELATDNAGNLYICDQIDNQRIRKINSAGIITTITGLGYPTFAGDGGPAIAGGINGPFAIALDGSRNIYFTDRQNNRVRKISYPNITCYFVHGATTSIPLCSELISLDTLLKVADADTGQTLYWNIISGPSHGVATATYHTFSTGGIVTPVGTSYTPTSGYAGPDTVRVSITDGMASDTITLCFDVHVLPPTAATISGPDTVCAGDTILLTAAAGGAWSGSAGIAISGGAVSGVTTGTATVSYTITNACGSATSTHAVYVKNCPAGVAMQYRGREGLSVYPNPSTGKFTISFNSATHSEGTVTITDAVGRTIKRLAITANKPANINIDTPGLYFVRCVMQDGAVFSKNLILIGNE